MSAARYQRLYQRKIKAYRWLYEFTQTQCTACADSDCACKDSICRHVEEQALKQGQRFAHTGHRLRFIGCQGCVVPPHLRETCTIYLCPPAQNAPGFARERYERLKNLCSKIDVQLMQLEEHAPAANH